MILRFFSIIILQLSIANKEKKKKNQILNLMTCSNQNLRVTWTNGITPRLWDTVGNRTICNRLGMGMRVLQGCYIQGSDRRGYNEYL